MKNKWYVIHSKPNMEQFLADQLNNCEIEYYFPKIKVHPVNPRARKTRPFFPGYLFIRSSCAEEQLLAFTRFPGASDMVHFGNEMAFVPDSIIQALQKKVQELNGTDSISNGMLKKGKRIKILKGPFAGYEAIFDTQMANTDRIKVFLTMIEKRMLEVEMPASYVN